MNEKIETIYFFCDSTYYGIFLLDRITRVVFMALEKGYIRGYIVLRLFFLSSYKSNFCENSYMYITVIDFVCVYLYVLYFSGSGRTNSLCCC